MSEKTDKAIYNKLCAKVRSIVGRGAQRDWDVGIVLHELRDSGLWNTRNTIGGRESGSFHSFCFRELSLQHAEVSRCLRISKVFVRDELRGWDSYGANLMANVKNEVLRKKLMRGFPAGVNNYTRDKIDSAVRDLPEGELFYPLKKRAIVQPRDSSRVLQDLTETLENKAGFYFRIEFVKKDAFGRNQFKASIVSKRGVEAVDVDKTVPAAVRNALGALQTKTSSRKAAA